MQTWRAQGLSQIRPRRGQGGRWRHVYPSGRLIDIGRPSRRLEPSVKVPKGGDLGAVRLDRGVEAGFSFAGRGPRAARHRDSFRPGPIPGRAAQADGIVGLAAGHLLDVRPDDIVLLRAIAQRLPSRLKRSPAACSFVRGELIQLGGRGFSHGVKHCNRRGRGYRRKISSQRRAPPRRARARSTGVHFRKGQWR
ncbi:hypothetical protein AI27_18015 [Sphingomonas sp. BHC-A]|nr:hypothetical protein AI27_18015 [Sphingomonas sp. BHC-A]